MSTMPAHYNGQARQLNKFFKALSDQTRRTILLILQENERSVGEIVSHFGLAQPTISRHLSVLKEADLVIDRRQGQQVIYSLNPRGMADSAKKFFGEFAGIQSILGA